MSYKYNPENEMLMLKETYETQIKELKEENIIMKDKYEELVNRIIDSKLKKKVVMTPQQEEKITELIRKYNDILLISMRLAVAEDFLNLLILNRDDQEFALKDLLDNKEELTNHIMKQFLKLNSSPILEELRSQEFVLPDLRVKVNKDKKLKEK